MIVITEKLKDLMDELKKTNAETYYHNIRVKNLVDRIILHANEDGEKYSEFEVNSICKGALLHDIGKLFVRNFTLTKQMRLTDAEKEEMKSHTTLGYEAICDELDEHEREIVKNICLYHHERIDGNGYFGKTDIPLYVKLVAICDVYDSLTMDRIYRDAIEAHEAIEMIERGECGAFEKTVVDYLRGSINL